jgi:uncharacterized protein (TIRG00374 family)
LPDPGTFAGSGTARQPGDPGETGAGRPPLSLRDRLLSVRTLVSFALAAAFILFVFRNLNLNVGEIAGNIADGNPLWIGAGFAVYYGAFPLRAWRWRRLLENAGLRDDSQAQAFKLRSLSEIYILSWFANCLVPAKLGDAYRGYLLRQRAGASFARTLGTVLAERFMDVLALVGLMVLSALLTFHGNIPADVRWPLIGGAALVVLGIAGLGVVARYRTLIVGLVPERFTAPYERLQGGVLSSFARSGVPQIVGATILIWGAEGVRVFVVAAAFGVDLTVPEALFVALLASLLTVVPLTPAGLGVVESGTIIALRLLDVSDTNAATIALVDRGIAYWSVIVVGAALSVALRKR